MNGLHVKLRRQVCRLSDFHASQNVADCGGMPFALPCYRDASLVQDRGNLREAECATAVDVADDWKGRGGKCSRSCRLNSVSSVSELPVRRPKP